MLNASCSDPEVKVRCRHALDMVLRGVRQSSWPEHSWSFSRLGPGGYPVEFVWRPGAHGAFWTAEVAGPEMPEAQRLRHAVKLIGELTRSPKQSDTFEILASLQNGARMQWGSWLSGRHTPNTDRYKLYAEVPSDRTLDALRAFPSFNTLAHALPKRKTLRLVGFEPESGRIELYFRIATFQVGDFYRTMSNLGKVGSQLLKSSAKLCGQVVDFALEGKNIGFSLSLDSDGTVSGATIIVVARRLFGNDKKLQERLIEFASSPINGLAKLWLNNKLQSNLLSLSASPDGSTSFHLGLCSLPHAKNDEAL
jgi:hypothetical protein